MCALTKKSCRDFFSNPATVDLHSLDNKKKSFEHSVFVLVQINVQSS